MPIEGQRASSNGSCLLNLGSSASEYMSSAIIAVLHGFAYAVLLLPQFSPLVIQDATALLFYLSVLGELLSPLITVIVAVTIAVSILYYPVLISLVYYYWQHTCSRVCPTQQHAVGFSKLIVSSRTEPPP